MLVGLVLTVSIGLKGANADGFAEPASWATYDPGANGIGDYPDGYHGVAFDGRYLYFSPHANSTGYHGEVLRYDTQGPFDEPSSWDTFDAVAGIGAKGGYVGAVFDDVHGYMYFVPMKSGASVPHSEVLRYNTQADFNEPASWEKYEQSADPVGYGGGAFDGRYLYFASGYYNAPVLRYDTQSPFDNPLSWETLSLLTCGAAGGRSGPVFDGRHVYFAPGSEPAHGEALRYDTSDPFGECASWEWYDYGDNCGEDCNDPDGYTLPSAFDEPYVYFAPFHNGTIYHAEVLRYDTSGPFSSASSWATFDALSEPVPGARGGSGGAVTDGTYAYLVPRYDGSDHATVLRYNTTADFQSPSSWDTSDATAHVDAKGGYVGAVFDGRFVYFAPYAADGGTHGEVLRYDTSIGIPTVSEWGLVAMSLLVLTAGTLVYARRRAIHA